MATAQRASGTPTPGRSARVGRKRDGMPWHSPLTQVIKGALYQVFGWLELPAGYRYTTDRVINSITPRLVRKGFYIYPSSKIPVITLDIHYRLDAATLGEQRRGGSPTPPSALARGRLIIITACQQRPDNPGILVRDRDCRTVFAAALDQLPYPLTPSVRPAVHPADRRPR